MNLLTDDDKALLVLEHLGPAALAGDTMSLYDCFQLALDVAEKAVLAKLAAMDLPKPVSEYEEVVGHEEWQGCASELIEMREAYSSDQMRQAFAQGAASQLSAEPCSFQYKDNSNGTWYNFINEKHLADTRADGRWDIRAVFTLKDAP